MDYIKHLQMFQRGEITVRQWLDYQRYWRMEQARQRRESDGLELRRREPVRRSR